MTAVSTHASTNAERHGSLAGEWLVSLTSENTRRAYRRDLHELFAFLDSGDVDALQAERRHIDLWRTTLTGAASTTARKLAAVSSFYTYALSGSYVRTNPVTLVKRPKINADYSATNGLTEQEARALIAAAHEDGPRSVALVSLLLVTGARLAEVLNARVDDLQHDAGHRVLVVHRKGGRISKLVVPAPVVHSLSTYLGQSTAEGTELASTASPTDNPPIFTTRTGRGWAASEAFRTVQRLARRAGIAASISPHSLRHTHATLALANGVALHDLQDSMDHADPRTTRRYDRSRRRLERSSAYAVASALA
ncbi:tyrosine-type recombinase/integrase [Microbacterium sp. BWR-S6Y]|uniref:tyrosine-type recombinase/integrase n=1 Tax=Microbacterium sp. BWR-S6Y TaxID=3232073 RepID=UPI00352799BD